VTEAKELKTILRKEQEKKTLQGSHAPSHSSKLFDAPRNFYNKLVRKTNDEAI